MKSAREKSVSSSKEIVAYLRGEKCTFQDVINEIQNPREEDLPLIDLTRKISERRRYQDIDSDIRTTFHYIEYFMSGYFLQAYNNVSDPESKYTPVEIIRLNLNNLMDIKGMRRELEFDKRIFCCYLSHYSDALTIILRSETPMEDWYHDTVVHEYFATQFSLEYDISAGFCYPNFPSVISYDPDIYVNYECERVNFDEIESVYYG